MKITIEAEPKELAELVIAMQDDQGEMSVVGHKISEGSTLDTLMKEIIDELESEK